MSWDFSTEPEFEKKLDWIREFVSEEVEPLEVLFPGCEFLPLNDERRGIVDPLKQQVRDNGLWAPHLGPELGGQGRTQRHDRRAGTGVRTDRAGKHADGRTLLDGRE